MCDLTSRLPVWRHSKTETCSRDEVGAHMPRYFFDICNNEKQVRDDSGTLLSDVHEARRAAIGILPNIARDELPDGDQHILSAIVRDEAGNIILRATLTLAAEWLE